MLSTANNIISRREQILDEAYNKSVQVVEESESKAREIIETAALAQDEAERIIAESEQKGDDIRQEAEIESRNLYGLDIGNVICGVNHIIEPTLLRGCIFGDFSVSLFPASSRAYTP